VKYEDVYLNAYESMADARQSLKKYFEFYNQSHKHQTLFLPLLSRSVEVYTYLFTLPVSENLQWRFVSGHFCYGRYKT
jgi:hypothetical protein